MKLTYLEQLKHPNWQRRRLEMLQAKEWACECCSGKEATLHVHHRLYVKGRMAWEYADHELAVLCEYCHANEHFEDETLKRLLSLIPVGQGGTFNASSLLSGFFGNLPQVAELAEEIGVHTRFQMIGAVAALMRGVPEKRLAEVATFVEKLAEEKWNG